MNGNIKPDSPERTTASRTVSIRRTFDYFFFSIFRMIRLIPGNDESAMFGTWVVLVSLYFFGVYIMISISEVLIGLVLPTYAFCVILSLAGVFSLIFVLSNRQRWVEVVERCGYEYHKTRYNKYNLHKIAALSMVILYLLFLTIVARSLAGKYPSIKAERLRKVEQDTRYERAAVIARYARDSKTVLTYARGGMFSRYGGLPFKEQWDDKLDDSLCMMLRDRVLPAAMKSLLNDKSSDRIYEYENDDSVRITFEIPEDRILGYWVLCNDDPRGVRFHPNPLFERTKIGHDVIRDTLWEKVRNKRH